MSATDRIRAHRVASFLSPKGKLARCSCLLAVLVVSTGLFMCLYEPEIDTQGWKVTDLIEHLQQRGLHLRVIPGDGPCNHAYLTEDDQVTWEAMQETLMSPQHIRRWRGTVWVGYDHFGHGESAPGDWGINGCQIGTFLLFGDERLLREIQAACRWRRGDRRSQQHLHELKNHGRIDRVSESERNRSSLGSGPTT